MQTVRPKPLREGDTIAIVSPSSPVPAEKLEAGVSMLERHGFRVVLGQHVLDRHHFFAGSDAARAGDLMWAFNDPQIDAVLCSRGGYGCSRLLPLLDLDKMAASGKPFLGYSDITVLHLALNRRGLQTYHAPMPSAFYQELPAWVEESVIRLLKGDPRIADEAPKPETLVGGVAEGWLVGGCLRLICDSLGTAEEIQTDGKILMMEDVDEHPHRVDAMLTHLELAGKLESASGFLVGEMTNTDDHRKEAIPSWYEIVREKLLPYKKPTLVKMPIGHVDAAVGVVLGAPVRMDADRKTLEY